MGIGTAIAALAAWRAIQDGHRHRGDAVSFHHDFAQRRQSSGGAVGLKLERADRLPQDCASLLDRRELRGTDIERRLRDRRDRYRLDLDITDVDSRPPG